MKSAVIILAFCYWTTLHIIKEYIYNLKMNCIPIRNEDELSSNKENNMDGACAFIFLQKDFKKEQIY